MQKMRRKEKQITDPIQIDDIIHRSKVLRLAMSVDDQPYVVPLNFGYSDGCLYFHSAHQGRKIDMIKANPRVSFVFDLDIKLTENEQACEWGCSFRSVIGFGQAVIVKDVAEKIRAVKAIMAQYSDLEFKLGEKEVAKVAVVRVDIDGMTGKTGYKEAD